MALPVANLMSRCPVAVDPCDSLDLVESAIDGTRTRHLLVVEDDQLIGVIASRDLAPAMPPDLHGRARERWLVEVSAGDIMRGPPVQVDSSEPAAHAAALLDENATSCLAVVDGRWPVGLVTISDFVRHAIELLAEEEDRAGTYPEVARFMTTSPVVIARPADAVAIADILMRRARIHHLPVLDGDDLVGILSDLDVLAALPSSLGAPQGHHEVSVRDVMTPEPVTVSADEEAALAAAMLLANRIGSLPVVAGDRLIGIVTERDFLSYIARQRTM